ncbi:MAG: TdeIII family type II restriction endonuclease [Phototrophicales bacterium]|nr:MAG: TdeIII family type II restriction endonuclease [Phototrophicales bacterium]
MNFSWDEAVAQLLRDAIRKKLANYNPETTNMPFHTLLLGKDRMALYSFVQSLNTNFGTAIFEPVALLLAEKRFKTAQKQVVIGKKISLDAQFVIQNIMNRLSDASSFPSKSDEVDAIRQVCRTGEMTRIKTTRADLLLEDMQGVVYLFDLKTAKPNAGMFKDFKRTLLEWIAMYLVDHNPLQIHTAIAIPYNPYAPQPYERWTLRGMFDLDAELYVAEQFWDFIGGEGAYHHLLTIFERVGIELQDEIHAKFSQF